MIEPMKKITLLTLADEQRGTLEKLRDLGVMQIINRYIASEDTGHLYDRCRMHRQLLGRLGQFPTAAPAALPPGFAELEDTLGEYDDLNQKISELLKKQENLSAWGNFRRQQLDELAANGVNILFCSGSQDDFEAASQAEEVDECLMISNSRKCCFFVVISLSQLDENKFPAVKLAPDDDPETVAAELQKCRNRQSVIQETLSSWTKYSKELEEKLLLEEEMFEFSQAQDALSKHGEISVLDGFVPEREVALLQEHAKSCGWGLLISDPDNGDDVPVLIRQSKFSRLIKPLFDFLGIDPGYHEIDASSLIMIFFTVFYAIIVGDAGYGMLFLLATILAFFKLKNNKAARLPLALMTILSCATIVWGVLTGSYFGVSYGGLECFKNPELKDQSIQCFCFLLAVAQLTSGRVWLAVKQRKWRSVLSNTGWILMLWGNFFLSYQLLINAETFPPQIMYALYGTGFILLVLTGVNWKDPADVFQFPFSIINSFTDILSYIRLFAVGMAGACIAANFNSMGMDVAKSSPWFIVFGILIIIIGHLLNLALTVMSVMVHAVRLNTLEFSNHIGLTWSGQKFQPFKHHKNNNEGK